MIVTQLNTDGIEIIRWQKEGVTTSMPSPEGTLWINSCAYKNRMPTHIKELTLSSYNTGHYNLVVKIHNELSYQRLKKHVIRAGFPAPDWSDAQFQLILLYTDDRTRLMHFFKTIRAFAPEIADIEQEVANTLDINLTSFQVSIQTSNMAETVMSTDPIYVPSTEEEFVPGIIARFPPEGTWDVGPRADLLTPTATLIGTSLFPRLHEETEINIVLGRQSSLSFLSLLREHRHVNPSGHDRGNRRSLYDPSLFQQAHTLPSNVEEAPIMESEIQASQQLG